MTKELKVKIEADIKKLKSFSIDINDDDCLSYPTMMKRIAKLELIKSF
jgi:hypothetical protein